MQETATDPQPKVEAFPVNTAGGSLVREIERVCVDNELVIKAWSPIHLRTKLKDFYWKDGQPAAGAFWEDTLRYLHLPRLKDREVLAQAIRSGAASRDFFGTAYGEHDGVFEGFHLGEANIQFDDTLLLIEPGAALAYEEKSRPELPPSPPDEPNPPVPTHCGADRGLLRSWITFARGDDQSCLRARAVAHSTGRMSCGVAPLRRTGVVARIRRLR
jgi:hypothetical protein